MFDLDGLERAYVDGEKMVISQPVGGMVFSHVEQFAGHLSEAVNKKSRKTPPYPAGCILVVYCVLNTLYPAS